MRYANVPEAGFKCPVCASPTGARLYETSAEAVAQGLERKELNAEYYEQIRAEIERLWGGRNAAVVRCGDCGLCSASPFVAGSPRYYEVALRSPSFPRWRWEFGKTKQVLQSLVGENKQFRLLEIGGGDGAFIKSVAPDVIPKSNVLVTEYSPAGHAIISGYGIDCRMIDLRDLKSAGCGDFNAVCLFHVLEHLDDPHEVIRAIGELTQNAAHVFISVPNAQYIEFCELHDGLLDLPPNHVGRWTRKSFESLASQHGWKVVDHEVEPASLGTILKSVSASRYTQKRAVPGSLANVTSQFRNRLLRRIAGSPVFGAYWLGTLPMLLAADRAKLGPAQWVHLSR